MWGVFVRVLVTLLAQDYIYDLLKGWRQRNVDTNERPLQEHDLVKLVFVKESCLASSKDLNFYHCSKFARNFTDTRRVVKVSFVPSGYFTLGQGSFYSFRGKKLDCYTVEVFFNIRYVYCFYSFMSLSHHKIEFFQRVDVNERCFSGE